VKTVSRLLGFLLAVAAAPAYACPACYGGGSTGGRGMNAAILFLVAMVGFVQIGMAALFFRLWRRTRDVIEGGGS
jgi:hypothetical protein